MLVFLTFRKGQVRLHLLHISCYTLHTITIAPSIWCLYFTSQSSYWSHGNDIPLVTDKVQLSLYMVMKTVTKLLPHCLHLVVETKVLQLINYSTLKLSYMKCQMITVLSCSGQCNLRRQRNRRSVYRSGYSALQTSVAGSTVVTYHTWKRYFLDSLPKCTKCSFLKCMSEIHCLHTVKMRF